MCYSAMIWADFRRYTREWQAKLSIDDFVRLFWWKWNPDEIYRKRRGRPIIPRSLEEAFRYPQTEEEAQIKTYIDEYRASDEMSMQAEIFKQRTRLADAERDLAERAQADPPKDPTKKLLTDLRVAPKKIEQNKAWIHDLHRTEAKAIDSRMFPLMFVPVMIVENGERIIKPMRYQCRPLNTPPKIDQQYPGTYNARRDNLAGPFWKSLFGRSHGLIVASRFFENVPRHKAEHRELREGEEPENLILEFNPQNGQDMLVACIWSHWRGPGEEDLLSFAAITDEPPEEVAAAGHDRCIMPIQPEHVDEWLQPRGNLKRMQEILDDRERPYYEHRLAA